MDDHVIQMRWADLDMLNHVNNVRYVDYADDARHALADAGEIDPDLVVARCDVEFVRPLLLSLNPVHVSAAIDAAAIDTVRLRQEIYVESEGNRTVFARITTDLSRSLEALAARGLGAPEDTYKLRRRDAPGGIVSNANLFEAFQEARLLVMSRLIQSDSAGGFVVARVAIDHADALPWRLEPYAVRSWVEKYGRSSIELGAEITDGDHVYARATAILVGFDLEAQRSRPLTEAERSCLDEALSSGVAS